MGTNDASQPAAAKSSSQEGHLVSLEGAVGSNLTAQLSEYQSSLLDV